MMVSVVSYGAVVAFYLACAALVLISGRVRGPALLFLLACLATACWSGSIVLSAVEDQMRPLRDLLLETIRNSLWIAFLYRLLEIKISEAPSRQRRIAAIVGTFLFLGTIFLADLAEELGWRLPVDTAGFLSIARLIVPILGLMLIENLARNDRAGAFWSTRFVYIALGGAFAYDLFLYSEALLMQRVNPDLYAARGLVNAIGVPLLVIAFARNPDWAIDMHVSRRFVFHSMTLVGSGGYLILMAIAGYYLRSVGGSWGTLLQVTFSAAALVIVLLALSSGTFRSKVRVLISRHFFSNKYDYRHEWLQFITLLSAQESLLPLHERVIQAIANILDSPAGSLWMREENENRFVNTASWNMPLQRESQPLDRPMTEFFERTGLPLTVTGAPLAVTAPMAVPAAPAFIASVQRVWLVVPLIHRDRLRAFLVLTTPRVGEALTVEDLDLLMMVGKQAASYLAEDESGKALTDARQLEAFNRRFAFVVHDIKNLASQLSLILKNAEKHGANPEFQRDVINTVRHSVSRMTTLLEQLGAERRRGLNPSVLNLVSVLDREYGGRLADQRLKIVRPPIDCLVEVDDEQLTRVLRHVVQNALDAAGEAGAVVINLRGDGKDAVIEVMDNGPGMTPEFIRDHLFRPFDSTKSSGYGIGAFQARQIIREMGGRLDVMSQVGRGTTIGIYLPQSASTRGATPQARIA